MSSAALASSLTVVARSAGSDKRMSFLSEAFRPLRYDRTITSKKMNLDEPQSKILPRPHPTPLRSPRGNPRQGHMLRCFARLPVTSAEEARGVHRALRTR